MNLIAWQDSRIKRLRWYDISLIKLSSAAFALWIAHIWAPLLSWPSYSYLGIGILAAIVPMAKYLKK